MKANNELSVKGKLKMKESEVKLLGKLSKRRFLNLAYLIIG